MVVDQGSLNITSKYTRFSKTVRMRGSKGGQGVRIPPTLKNHKSIGFL